MNQKPWPCEFYRVLIDDPGGRFTKGEIGKFYPATGEYKALLDLGTQYMELFGNVIVANRHYYFFADEIEPLKQEEDNGP